MSEVWEKFNEIVSVPEREWEEWFGTFNRADKMIGKHSILDIRVTGIDTVYNHITNNVDVSISGLVRNYQ